MASRALQDWRLEGGSAAAELPVGPNDREIVDTLRRVALAKAHLAQAEVWAEALRLRTEKTNRQRDLAIGEAHADVEWAQAAVLAAPRSRKAARELRLTEAREAAALHLYGFDSWEEYDEARRSGGETDPHLALARRECEAAADAWSAVQTAFSATVVIDLTGDEARVIT